MQKLLLGVGAAAFALLTQMTSTMAQAQATADPDRGDLINWYYSATFGTGVYTSGDRSVSVLQVPYSRAWKNVDDDGYGLKFKVASTLGFYDYNVDSVFGGNVPNRISTLSVLPGIEWELPMSRRWTVRPYADAGYGEELTGGESAWIYDFGLKSRFLMAKDQGVEFALVNSLTSAGYRQRGGTLKTFGYLATGLDITVPTGRTVFGRPLDIGFTPIYFYYFNRLSLTQFDDSQNRIREGAEFAVSFTSRKPWSFRFFDIDRVGLSIRTSGDVTGVSLFTSLPF
ncbi:MAG: hypothetical protein ABI619_10305 [Betaproteobacteria bacterium]